MDLSDFVERIGSMKGITKKDMEKIKKKYINMILKINKLQKRYKIYNILPKIVIYIPILLMIAIPYLLMILKGVYSDIENITKYLITIGGFIAGITNFIVGMFGFTQKIFVYEQTKIRLFQEGARILSFKHEKRYSKFSNVHDALDEFFNKVARIVQYAVLRNGGSSDTKITSSKSFQSIGNEYLGIGKMKNIDEELERYRTELKDLEKKLSKKEFVNEDKKEEDITIYIENVNY